MTARPDRARILALGLILVSVIGLAPHVVADDDAEAEARRATDVRGDAYAYLMRSMFAARRGEFRAAASDIRRAIRLQPEAPEVYIQGASLLRSMGRHDEAGQIARQALELDPTNPETLKFVAEHAADTAIGSNADSKSLREALDLYERLEAIETLDAQSLRKVANLKMLLGDMDGAIESATRLAEQRPGDVDVTRMLYRLLVHNQQEGEALVVLLRFVTRHPFEAGMVEEADRLASKLNAWQLVIEELSQNESLVKGENPAQGLRGQALLRLERMEEAADALEKAVAADSFNVRARLRLVWAYRNLRRLADASVVARGLADENPGDSTMQIVFAQILDQQRDITGALDSYADALLLLTTGKGDEGKQERDTIRQRVAELHLQQDQIAAARRIFDAIETDDPVATAQLGAQLAIAEENWDAAREASKLLRDEGRGGNAAMLDGEILARQDRWSKAEVQFREAIDELGPYYRFGVARLYQELGRGEEGRTWTEEWVESAPEDANAHFDHGRYLYLLESFDEAEVALSRAFELDPNHAAALNFLGYGLAEKGERLDEALNLVQRALVIAPSDGAYLDSLGWVYFQMGRYDAAREPLEMAAREYPTDATILDHLGDLYSGIGENDLALAAWSRALEGAPDNADAIRSKIARAETSIDE